MKKILLSALLVFSVNIAQGADTTAQAVPKNLHIYKTNGHAYVDLIATSCSDYRYFLDTSHPRYESIFSILLAAQLASKKVRLRFDGCNSIGQGNIVGVYLSE